MDFSTIYKKIESNLYLDLDSFRSDLLLMCKNAMTYNTARSHCYKAAKRLESKCKQLLGEQGLALTLTKQGDLPVAQSTASLLVDTGIVRERDSLRERRTRNRQKKSKMEENKIQSHKDADETTPNGDETDELSQPGPGSKPITRSSSAVSLKRHLKTSEIFIKDQPANIEVENELYLKYTDERRFNFVHRPRRKCEMSLGEEFALQFNPCADLDLSTALPIFDGDEYAVPPEVVPTLPEHNANAPLIDCHNSRLSLETLDFLLRGTSTHRDFDGVSQDNNPDQPGSALAQELLDTNAEYFSQLLSLQRKRYTSPDPLEILRQEQVIAKKILRNLVYLVGMTTPSVVAPSGSLVQEYTTNEKYANQLKPSEPIAQTD